MENINELIFRVNNNLRNNLQVEKDDIKELLAIAMKMEKQLALCNVVGEANSQFAVKIAHTSIKKIKLVAKLVLIGLHIIKQTNCLQRSLYNISSGANV